MTRDKRNEYARNRYATLKALHRCIRCGSPNDTDKTMCSSCLEKQRELNAQNYKKMVEKRRAHRLSVKNV